MYIFLRNYIPELEKFQKKQTKKRTEGTDIRLKNATRNVVGDSVQIVSAVNTGREVSDMYLKHPGNESSEDEEAEQEAFKDLKEQKEKEDDLSFHSFIQNYQKCQVEKRLELMPGTSKGT